MLILTGDGDSSLVFEKVAGGFGSVATALVTCRWQAGLNQQPGRQKLVTQTNSSVCWREDHEIQRTMPYASS